MYILHIPLTIKLSKVKISICEKMNALKKKLSILGENWALEI